MEVDEGSDAEGPAPRGKDRRRSTTREKRAEPAGGPVPGAQRLTLYASPKVVRAGEKVAAWGRLSPQGGNRWVQILNAHTGHKIASVRTDPQGRFSTRIRVRKNVAFKARRDAVVDVVSKWRRIAATPRLKVAMDHPLLFSRAGVSGRISRAAGGRWIQLKLRRLDTGKIVDRRSVRSRRSGRFDAGFVIKKPGTYRVIAAFDHDDWRPASKKTRKKSTPLPSLGAGSQGIFVKLLERRLVQLAHHLSGKNTYYGQDTSDAVMAFNKVNGRPRTSSVTASTWHALSSARRPKPRFAKPRFHIEVNQSKQVLFVVRKGKVKGILHVSTGAPSTPTYDGTYQFWGKIAGYSPKRLYYPSYFHGARAIHGWPSVPPYNASHGCVRVPMWAAKWIYSKTEIGDTIKVYH
jgi:hypothetical protein